MRTASSLENTATRFAVALVAAGTAFLVRWLLTPAVGDHLPYITFFLAVAFSARYCGIGPSVLVITTSVFAARYWIIQPAHAFGLADKQQQLDTMAFLLISSVVVAFGEANRRNKERLRQVQNELDSRIAAANQNIRDLTGQLLHLQDDERRRIARELHDSVGQSLAALAMNLDRVAADLERLTKTSMAVADSTTLVKDTMSEIRTISYLLHPPMLDEAGLPTALRMYTEGFSERSGIRVSVDLSQDFGRLPRDMETAIFRLVQECLTNIHRHSGSSVADIRITRSQDDVRIEITDEGTGISPDTVLEINSSNSPGIGLRGMQERLRQLGGSLEVSCRSDTRGLRVAARLPGLRNSPITESTSKTQTIVSQGPFKRHATGF